MKLILRIVFLISVISFPCLSQITIHSITNKRGLNNGDGGYTLNGSNMNIGPRLKLLSKTNFGSNGIYSKSVNIDDGFGDSNSLTHVVNFPYSDLFYFGTFDKLDKSLVQFTNEEIDSLYNWSKKGGKVIICGGSREGAGFDLGILNSKWGFEIMNTVPSSFIPNTAGLNTDIFTGPFGSIDIALQEGSAQGYFRLLPDNVSVLATDMNNNPTIIMDCNTLDLIVADVDGYTSDPGFVSKGSSVTNDQDKFWVNTIVFMDKLQPSPQISNVLNTLSLNSTYNNYQWYLNNSALGNAINATYTITDTGNYYVETTLNGGCKLKSNVLKITSIPPVDPFPLNETFITPNIFTPDNDGLNDVFVFTTKNVTTLKCKIYNRWGILVSELTNANEGWDGNTTSGLQCVAGVYYWIVEYKDATGKDSTLKGFVQLVR